MMGIKKSIFIAVFGMFVSSINHANTVDLDKVIAIVNNEAITKSEYTVRYRRQQLQLNKVAEAVPDEIDLDLLRLLIDERIQVQVAYSRGIKVSKREVDNTLSNIAAQNNLTPNQLLEELATQGISPVQFARGIEEQTLIQRVVDASVNSRVTVSEQEIDYHLQAHKEIYTANESYEISHLFVSTSGKTESESASELENIQYIRQQLQQGHSFEKSVENYSDGENKKEGGYLGWRKEDQLPDLFLNALRQTPIGGVTEILSSANGFHIIKLHAKEGNLNIVDQQRIRHILVQPRRNNMTNEEAIAFLKDIALKIQQSGDFEKFARLHSNDDKTAEEGGNMGWINPGDAVPELEEAATTLPLNALSEPVRSRYGYHLIEVLERRKRDISQDIARQKAKQTIFQRKSADLFKSWFDKLRESAYIEIVRN